MDSLVVRTTAEATGNRVGGSGQVKGAAAERGELVDGVAADGKRRDATGEKNGKDGMGGTGGVDIFFQGEFGYELIAVLPFAYWHHLNGSLRSTTSCGRHSLASLYYFSPNHTDDATCHRSDMKDNVAAYGFPGGIHYSHIPPTWQPPPLAYYFRKLPPVWPEIPKGSRLGGGSIVESFFGGKNIIYFREGQEVKGRAYERIYPQLSGAKVKVVTSYEGLVKKVDGMIKKNKCHVKLH
ncbi:unnamed protein product [Closterium sp. Naga37s-1]|nr:unnamed protein product [Closterium sp. Naga37s-1]